MWIIGAIAVVGVIVLIGTQMNNQASASGPRKGTNHLAKIRKKSRRR